MNSERNGKTQGKFRRPVGTITRILSTCKYPRLCVLIVWNCQMRTEWKGKLRTYDHLASDRNAKSQLQLCLIVRRTKRKNSEKQPTNFALCLKVFLPIFNMAANINAEKWNYISALPGSDSAFASAKRLWQKVLELSTTLENTPQGHVKCLCHYLQACHQSCWRTHRLCPCEPIEGLCLVD